MSGIDTAALEVCARELAEANRSAPVSLAGGHASVRVTDRRWVRVRPWVSAERDHDDVIAIVEFQVLGSNNGGAANDLELEGTIRWDGCANWHDPGAAVHLCGPEEADEIAACLRAAYALADDVMGGESEFQRPAFEPFAGDLDVRVFSPPEWP